MDGVGKYKGGLEWGGILDMNLFFFGRFMYGGIGMLFLFIIGFGCMNLKKNGLKGLNWFG